VRRSECGVTSGMGSRPAARRSALASFAAESKLPQPRPELLICATGCDVASNRFADCLRGRYAIGAGDGTDLIRHRLGNAEAHHLAHQSSPNNRLTWSAGRLGCIK
jgi:hypothetical protein